MVLAIGRGFAVLLMLVNFGAAVAEDSPHTIPQHGVSGPWVLRTFLPPDDPLEPVHETWSQAATLELVERSGKISGTFTTYPEGEVRPVTGSVEYGKEAVVVRMEVPYLEPDGTPVVHYYEGYLMPFWSNADGQEPTILGSAGIAVPGNPDFPGASVMFVAAQPF